MLSRTPSGQGCCCHDRDVVLGKRAVEGAGAGDPKVGAKVGSRNEWLEFDRRTVDRRQVLAEECLDMLVPCDSPEWPGTACLVVAEVVRETAVGAVVVLTGA